MLILIIYLTRNGVPNLYQTLSGDKLIPEIFLYTAVGVFAIKETCVFSVDSKLWATSTYTHPKTFWFSFMQASILILLMVVFLIYHFIFSNIEISVCLLMYLEINNLYPLGNIFTVFVPYLPILRNYLQQYIIR